MLVTLLIIIAVILSSTFIFSSIKGITTKKKLITKGIFLPNEAEEVSKIIKKDKKIKNVLFISSTKKAHRLPLAKMLKNQMLKK